MKPCSVCKMIKPLTDFQRKAGSRTGHASACRACDSARRIQRKIDAGTRRPDPPAGSKWCGRCSTAKVLADFYVSSGKATAYCRVCTRTDNTARARARGVRERPSRTPQSARRWYLRTNYGLTLEDYNALMDAQKGRCPVCAEELSSTRPAVDHDHRCCPGSKSCGICVRGILCTRCNLLLGKAKERRDVLVGAIAYLDEHGEFSPLS